MAVSPSYDPRSRPRATARSSVSVGLTVASFMRAGKSASARISGLASTLVGGGTVNTMLRLLARGGGDFRACAVFRFFLAAAIAMPQKLGVSFFLAIKLSASGVGRGTHSGAEGRRGVFRVR